MRSLLLVCCLVACAGSPQDPPNVPEQQPKPNADAGIAPLSPAKPTLAKSSSTNAPPGADALELVLTAKGPPADFADAVKKSGKDDVALAVAPDVGYRMLLDAIAKLQEAGADDFSLLVEGPSGKAAIDVEVPVMAEPSSSSSASKPRADVMSGSSRRVPRLNLVVLVVSQGFSVKTSAGNFGPGCKMGSGLAIQGRDFEGLAGCVLPLKTGPFASGSYVTIGADPSVDFQTLVRTMDVLRPSFPSVTLGMAR